MFTDFLALPINNHKKVNSFILLAKAIADFGQTKGKWEIL